MRLPPSRPFSSMEVWLARSFRMLMKTSTQKSATGLESPTGTKALRPEASQPFSSTARYVLCTLVPLKTTLALCASWKNAGSRGSVRTRDLPTHVVQRWKSSFFAWMKGGETAFPVLLHDMKHPLAKQSKASSAIHRSLDELQFGHMALNHAIVDCPGSPRFHCVFLLFYASDPWTGVLAVHSRQPWSARHLTDALLACGPSPENPERAGTLASIGDPAWAEDL